ncbi:MAG TPA: tRNA lysidine(34) synthetase TilS [Methylovirgula sp.]|nr:tRNA lysidine(34) synthetase TilS [Methylovirgula sp.]
MDLFGAKEIAALFAPLNAARGALLAVSGGPDSVALMLLASAWAGQGTSKAKLAVATVDHGLRPQSRGEAEAVAGWAKMLGLPHEILIWEGEKPKTRIQERARAARYDLLFRHAGEIGADHVLTAHHADDQAETILFRLLRGSGIGGLAGMPVAARHGDILHLRPLLSYPKEALVGLCKAHSQAFFRDPSNEDLGFARTRMRRLLRLLAEEGLDSAALLRLARRAARAELALAACTTTLRASLDATHTNAFFSAPIGHLREAPEEILQRLIAAEIQALGGKPLRLDRLEGLAGALRTALQCGAAWRGTLGGMTLALDGRGSLTIRRERPRRRGRGTSDASEETALRGAATAL